MSALANGPDTRPEDIAEIERIVATFFAAFVSGEECLERFEELRRLFVPGAVIATTGGHPPRIDDVEGFIAPRAALLTSGRLVDFREWPEPGEIRVFGDIAQWFGSYVKTGRLDAEPYDGRGMKSMQFVRTTDGWRISAAAWDDERQDS